MNLKKTIASAISASMLFASSGALAVNITPVVDPTPGVKAATGETYSIAFDAATGTTVEYITLSFPTGFDLTAVQALADVSISTPSGITGLTPVWGNDVNLTPLAGTPVSLELHLSNPIVIVHKNKIVDVNFENYIPDSAQVIDLTGYTILPGLIDAHIHLQH